MSSVAFPYLRPAEDSVLASSWVFLADGLPVEPARGLLPHLDYSTRLRVSRRIQLSIAEVANATGHDPASLVLECIVVLGSGGARLSRMRRVLDRQQISGEQEAFSIDVAVPGEWISQSLALRTEVVFVSSSQPKSRLAPTLAGSRLWGDYLRVDVEPSSPRFPVEVVSFSTMFGEGLGDALWFLDWSPRDMEHDFGSSVRLYLNSDVADFIQRVHEADEITLRALSSAISIQMIRSALPHEGFAGSDYPATSVGNMIRDWIARSFPGQAVGSVRTLAEHDPARFEATIAGSIGGMATSD